MNRWLSLPLFLVLGILAGCGDTGKTGAAQGSKDPKGTQQQAALNPTLLEPLLLPQAPTDALSVKDAKARKDGEKVVLRGKLLPDNVQATNPGVAAFVLMSPEDLETKEVKEELACEDAATCPECRKLVDNLGVRVELVDKDGKVIPSTVQGFRKLGGGSLVTVEGVVKREGKDGKLVRIVAQRFYPG